MGRIPDFTADGLLPAGDWEVSLAELRESMLVVGPEEPARQLLWDTLWRRRLVDNLEILVGQLWQVGVTEIFVDGSFAEDKDHPNDIDGYFVCDYLALASGELERRLNLLDEHKVWTWAQASRRRYRGYAKKQLPMWHAYRVELYAHPAGLEHPVDEFGFEYEFPSAFRRSRRDGRRRGILKIRKPDGATS